MSTVNMQGNVGLQGNFRMKKLPHSPPPAERASVFLWHLKNWFQYRYKELPFYAFLAVVPLIRFFVPALCVLKSELRLKVLRGNARTRPYQEEKRELELLYADGNGIYADPLIESRVAELDRMIAALSDVQDLGVVGRHLVVTAGKNAVAGAFNSVAPSVALFKFHGYGTGTNSAAAGDTALQTELTTQYAVDSTRPTGSQANSTNTYTTIGTLSPDSGGTIAVTEWGLFSASSSTTLLDRQVFSAVNLVSGSDSVQTTYVLTIS